MSIRSDPAPDVPKPPKPPKLVRRLSLQISQLELFTAVEAVKQRMGNNFYTTPIQRLGEDLARSCEEEEGGDVDIWSAAAKTNTHTQKDIIYPLLFRLFRLFGFAGGRSAVLKALVEKMIASTKCHWP